MWPYRCVSLCLPLTHTLYYTLAAARNGYHRQDEENRDADADDRVESDILSANHIADLVPPQEWYDDGAAVRNYTQSPNRDLNALLSVLAVAAIGFAVGIATGHYIGKLALTLIVTRHHCVEMLNCLVF